jgi:hypothetical protein
VPRAPDWFLRELKLIDRYLTVEWDEDREAFLLLSRRGWSRSRAEVVPYGLFGRNELGTPLLNAIRRGIRYRDRGVTMGDIMAEKEAAKLVREEAASKRFSEATREKVTQEADALASRTPTKLEQFARSEPDVRG